VLAGAGLRVALMVPTLWRAGWRWRPVLDLRDREIVKLMKMMGLAILTMSIVQINIMISNLFAMYLGEGVKTTLVFSQRLIQFPMALTATAVATGMLPQLSAYLLAGKRRELGDLMAFSKRMEAILIVPAMLGLIAFGMPILQLVYERVNWTPQATAATYLALIWYAPGLLPMGWMRLLEPLYFARKDLKTPLKAALIGMVCNVALNWFFAMHTAMAQGGLALANSLSILINYGALAWYLRRDMRRESAGEAATAAVEPPTRMGETFWKAAVAATLACGGGRLLYDGIVGRFGAPAGTLAQAALLLPILAGVAALYFALARLLRAPDSQRATELLLNKLRRKSVREE
jgi:putative peptidoglycan lipid II flippase